MEVNTYLRCFSFACLVFRLVYDLAYSVQDIQHEAPARAYGVAFGVYIVEGPIHAHCHLST
jgi:hypothetical protein